MSSLKNRELLTRDAFRKAVFSRDSERCVVCGEQAQDAHHIIERRLFPDGGYYLDNGASVCGTCHLEAERTNISCEKLRELCGITEVVLPPHLYEDQRYDKWGNPILSNGSLLRGELFWDESVQKILSHKLNLFTSKVKYPRTYHLPWSPGVGKDDRVIKTLERFEGQEVVVTVKMDGENTTMYRDYIHARSLEYSPHASRDRVKALHAKRGFEIPYGWRICGENLYAKHSIHYKNLEHYFLLFSVWNERNVCLSWEETVEWANLLGFNTVPLLYHGPWEEETIRKLHQEKYNGDECEGYVVRLARSFSYGEFRHCVAKYVRENHVQTQSFWLHKQVVKNGTKGEEKD